VVIGVTAKGHKQFLAIEDGVRESTQSWCEVLLGLKTRAKGCLSRAGMLQMMFKLGQCAQQNWRRLHGFEELNQVITGVKFKDGVEVNQSAA